MPRPIRIALCQLTSQPSVEEGFAKVDSTIAEVSKQKADLAVCDNFKALLRSVKGLILMQQFRYFQNSSFKA